MREKIVLVALFPKKYRAFEEHLGLEYLKSSLEHANYQVTIIDGWLNELTVDTVYHEIMKIKDPLFIGISSYLDNTLPTINLITRLKNGNPNVTIVCGGFGPTFHPENYLNNGADIVIRGEGEKVIVDVANALKNNTNLMDIEGICYKNNGIIICNKEASVIKDLDVIPFPSRCFFNEILKQKLPVNMLTSRGSTYHSTISEFFKHNKGKCWRGRSIKNIVDEIESLYNQGVTNIKFIDDSFIDGDRGLKWSKNFVDELASRNIKVRLTGNIRIEKVIDQILKHLKRAGFYFFTCYIQKEVDSEKQIRKILELFQKYQLIVQLECDYCDKDISLEDIYNFLKETNFVLSFDALCIKGIGEPKIYEALKKWNDDCYDVYDMAVSPIITSRILTEEEIAKFYDYAIKLKNKGLEVFKKLLEIVKENENADLLLIVDNEIKNNRNYYETIKKELEELYAKNNLVYKRLKLPFI